MARTSSLEVVAGSRTVGTSRRSRSRKLSSGMKASTTSSSLSHGQCSTTMVGGWTSSGRDHWSFGSMPRRRRLQAKDASLLQRRNSVVARKTAVEAIPREEDDSKQLSMDEGQEQEVSVHGGT